MRALARRLSTTLLVLAAACGDRAADAPAARAAQAPNTQERESPLYGATPVDNLQVTQVEIDAPDLAARLDGTRLVVLSDFHVGLWSGNAAVAEAAVRRAAEMQADAFVLLGDYASAGAPVGELARVLAPLRGRPVFAVLGDRDTRTDSLEAQIVAALGEAGVRVLSNDRAAVERNGDTLFIGGINPDLIGRSAADQEWVVTTLASRNAVLLSHFPGIAGRVRENRFAAVLAGNTFCGDVDVPGGARLAFVDSVLLPGVATPAVERLYPIGRTTLFISCGIGYGFVPARFGAAPEIAVVTLRRVSATAPAPERRDAAVDSLLEQMRTGQQEPPAGPGT